MKCISTGSRRGSTPPNVKGEFRFRAAEKEAAIVSGIYSLFAIQDLSSGRTLHKKLPQVPSYNLAFGDIQNTFEVYFIFPRRNLDSAMFQFPGEL